MRFIVRESWDGVTDEKMWVVIDTTTDVAIDMTDDKEDADKYAKELNEGKQHVNS